MSKLLKVENVKHGIYTHAVKGDKMVTGAVRGDKMVTGSVHGNKLKLKKAY
jgi:hypothetical protein